MARIEQPTLRPVLRAEDFYLPPPGQPADAWRLVPPAERALRWYEEKAQRRLPRPQGTDLGPPTMARIDAGRWVADCPCGSAQVVTPEDPRMFCVECLPSAWLRVRFPTDVAAAEATVAAKPQHERFWWQPGDDAWNRPAEQEKEQPPKEELAQGLPIEGRRLP
ncbi:hypothetical protein ABZ208_13675 [Streptomyces sp. NPDC006208]|uniref:hypothetical protein n=1 Tax=Streptomyces sp. NPDC006208 TaxID=3156734 RepID=UPI0033B72B8C